MRVGGSKRKVGNVARVSIYTTASLASLTAVVERQLCSCFTLPAYAMDGTRVLTDVREALSLSGRHGRWEILFLSGGAVSLCIFGSDDD